MNAAEQTLRVERHRTGLERGGNDVSAKARKKGLEVAIHGWIDDLRDGLIQDLDVRVENAEQMRHLKRNFWNVKAN